MAPAKKQPNLLLIGLAVIVVLGIVAVVVSRGGDDDGGEDVSAQVAPVTVEGSPLVGHDSSAPSDAAVGVEAPVVTGTSFDGSEVTVGEGPAVVVFVAHWCPHCQAEVPVIAEWLASGDAPDDVALHAVSTSVDESAPNFPPSSWLADEGFDVPVLRDDADSTAASAFGLTSFPYFVAIGADGTVVERASGEIGIERLEALLDAARGG